MASNCLNDFLYESSSRRKYKVARNARSATSKFRWRENCFQINSICEYDMKFMNKLRRAFDALS